MHPNHQHLVDEADEDQLPAWCIRPFCRSNTQSEPEDLPHCSDPCESSDEEIECLRCCTDYYYCGKRGSEELARERSRASTELASDPPYTDREVCQKALSLTDSATKAALDWETDIESGSEDERIEKGRRSEDETDTEGSSVSALANWRSELVEGFKLIFFIALPMLARQTGSVLSRRMLCRIFGRQTP